MADYTLSVEVSGSNSSFQQVMKQNEKLTASFKSQLKDFSAATGQIGQSMTGLGKTITALTSPLAVTGAAAVKTGIDYRAFKDNAQAAFTTLIGSAEGAKTHLDSIMEIARGTPFAFPDLVTANRNLLAFGLNAEKSKTVLKSITNAVGAMGGGAAEIEQMSLAFGKLQTQGKMSMDIVNQFSAQGVDALRILANKAGVSADEMRKKISKGAIDSNTAIEQLVDGINNGSTGVAGSTVAMGTAMENLKKTFGGSVDSMKSQFRYLGETLINEAAFEEITKGVNLIRDSLKQLIPIMQPVGEAIAQGIGTAVEKIKQLTDAFFTLSPEAQQTIMKIAGVALAAGPLLMIGGKLMSGISSITGALSSMSGILGGLISPVGAIVAAIALLALAFAQAYGENDEFRAKVQETMSVIGSSVAPVMQSIIGVVSTLWGAIQPVFQAIASVIMDLIISVLPPLGEAFQTIGGGITDALMAAQPAISALATAIGEIGAALAPVIGQLIASFLPAMESIIDVVVEIVGALAPLIAELVGQLTPILIQVGEIIAQLAAMLAPIIAQITSALVPIIQQVMGFISQLISALMPPIIEIIGSIMAVINALMPVIQKIISVVSTVISTVVSIITPIIQIVTGIITAIVNVIAPIVAFIANVIAQIVGVIAPILEVVVGVLNAVLQTFSAIFQAIYGVVSGIINRVKDTFTSTFSAIKGAWTGLTNFVSGIFEGVRAAVEGVVNKAKSIINGFIRSVNWAIDIINNIPGVNIGRISELKHGTQYWEGGFAIMNEGGRGELVQLPNGAQVIPHDVSMQYAREAGRDAASESTPGDTNIRNIEVNNNFYVPTVDPVQVYHATRKAAREEAAAS